MPISEREQAFLAQIAADPFDNGVRLVYADWLDEQSDPRGELIRLQVEHERDSPEWLGRHGDSYCADLQEAIDEVTRRHWRRWCGVVPPAFNVEMEGGLLRVRVPVASALFPANPDDCRQIADWWERFRPWVVRLTLWSCDDAILGRLIAEGYLHGISRLAVPSHRFTREGMQALGGLAGLRDISLAGTAIDDCLAHLRPLQNLQRLNLSHAQVSADDLEHLTALPALRRLELTTVGLRAEEGHLRRLTQLEQLTCWQTSLPDDGGFLWELVNLRRLNLEGRVRSGRHLSYLAGMTRLEELRLGHVPAGGLRAIGRVTSLRRLAIEGGDVFDEGSADLRSLSRLEVLDLNDTPTPASAAQHLGTLPALRHVRAHAWRLDAENLKSLAQARSLMTLEVGRLTDSALPGLAGLPCLRKLVLGAAEDRQLERLPILAELTDLDVSLTGSGDGLVTLVRQPKLTRLCLRGNAFELRHVARLLSLRKLRLANRNLLKNDLGHLAGLTELRELELTDMSLDHHALLPLGRLPHLAILDCGGSSVGGDALEVLADTPALDTLHLRTLFDHAGLAPLAPAPRLRVLSVSGHFVKERDVAALQAARPGLTVYTH